MTSQTLGLIVGGLIPALIFGFGNVFIKSSTSHGISTAAYLLVVGISVIVVGVIFFLLTGDRHVTTQGGIYAFFAGAAWASGIACVTIALQKYNAPISQLSPLFNMNTLIAVLLGLWIFAEWQHVKVPQLLIGSLLIVIGGVLVAKA